jgi:hypothetical protein
MNRTSNLQVAQKKNVNLSAELNQAKTQLVAAQAEVAHVKTFTREAHGKCIWCMAQL